MYRAPSSPTRKTAAKAGRGDMRANFGALFLAILGLIIVGRLFQLQILEGKTYRVLASDQHSLQEALIPKRGTIYVRERINGDLHPLAQDRDAWQVYAVPREIKNASTTADTLSAILNIPSQDLLAKISSTGTSYAVLAKDVPLDSIDAIKAKRLKGIGTNKLLTRWYPEAGVGGQVLGFVNLNDKNERVGRYGVEGYFHDTLAGEPGQLNTEKDAAGRRLTIASTELTAAHDGSDIVLTIDRTIQYEACSKVKEAVDRFGARSATIVIMDPYSGAILAMCSSPDFDPANVGKITDVGVLNNPATFYQYEPGSIFKPLTLSAAIDAGKITPYTTYTDTGAELIDGFTIRNSDLKAHGLQTMKDVLSKSLNTGTIFVGRQLGREPFQEYMKKFGLGQKTGVELKSEVVGNISSLERKGKIFAATASFGQGLTVTPIEMIQAYSALGNGGQLIRPRIVSEIIHPDGTHEVMKPDVVRQVISPNSSRLISAMMVDVVENGHGKRAGVPGYYVAGKTGTAQVSDPNGKGYLKDETIGSFAGFAPADHPAFAMLVKIDHPTTVQFAESSAAPIFGELASFLLSYMQIPPTRPVKAPLPPPTLSLPSQNTASTSTR